MSDFSPLWCFNEERHPEHRERNEFNDWNYCTGRPESLKDWILRLGLDIPA